MKNTQATILNEIVETSVPLITLTSEATAVLQEMMSSAEDADTKTRLRVFVSGGGCAGLQYGLALDDYIDDGDTVIDGPIPLVVDPASLPHLRGSVVSYVSTDMGGTFKVENPNATGGCGCGNSFSTDDWENGDPKKGDPKKGDSKGCGGCSGGADGR